MPVFQRVDLSGPSKNPWKFVVAIRYTNQCVLLFGVTQCDNYLMRM